jgi:hypothetical protein
MRLEASIGMPKAHPSKSRRVKPITGIESPSLFAFGKAAFRVWDEAGLGTGATSRLGRPCAVWRACARHPAGGRVQALHFQALGAIRPPQRGGTKLDLRL